MKARILIAVYYLAIVFLALCAGVIIFKLMFWPPCTPSGPKDTICIVDGWSVAGLAGTVLGLAGTVLALLGAFAVATWWTGLDKRISELVNPLLVTFNGEIKKTREVFIYLGLADLLHSQKNTQEALEYYKKAGSLLPTDAQMNYILGRIYSGMGEYDLAITSLEASHPEETVDQAKVQKELGLAYRRRGQDADYDKAIEYLKRATILHPNDSDTWAILGGLYRRKKEYLKAYESYENARRIDPDSSYALGNLASLAWYLGKLSISHMYFGYFEVAATTQIKKGQPEVYWAFYDLALAQLAEGKIADAKDTYKKAIAATPGNVQFDAVLSNLYLLQQAPQPLSGVDEIVKMLENAKANRISKSAPDKSVHI